MTRRVVITAANRGVGLALTRHAIARGDEVWGTARDPEAATELAALGPAGVVQLDVMDEASVAACSVELASKLSGIDLLINNAGVNGTAFGAGDDDRGALDISGDVFMGQMQLNALGPLLVTRSLLPTLKAGDDPLVANISSQLGSMVVGARAGNDVGYNASKAALNMVTVMLARDLDTIRVMAFHPGWVQTDMGGASAAVTPDNSAIGLLDTIANLDPKATGGFLTWEGTEHPW